MAHSTDQPQPPGDATRAAEPPGRDHADPARDIIPGAYESDTLTHREPGAIGGRFNGADSVSADDEVLVDPEVREEMRRIGGGEKHERETKADDQRSRRR